MNRKWQESPSNWARLTAIVGAPFISANPAQAQPANDTCQNALPIPFASLPYITPPLSVANAARESEADACATFGYTVWYTFIATSDADLILETCAEQLAAITLPDTVIALYTTTDGTCAALTLVNCNDDACGFRSSLMHHVLAGQTYFIQVGMYIADFRTLAPTSPDDILSLSVRLAVPPNPGEWIEQTDSGDLPATAQVIGGSTLSAIRGELGDSDSDMYRLDICDAAAFSATTVGGAGFDTQLFLFDASGKAVMMNDDEVGTLSKQSRIVATPALSNFAYYLAISTYNRDPIDGDGNLLFADVPYRVQHSADGPGAAHAIANWSMQSGTGGAYTITLTGCAPAGTCGPLCPPCIADFDNNGGVDGGDVAAFFPVWEAGDPCADVNFDGGVDGGDVETFFRAWEAGGC